MAILENTPKNYSALIQEIESGQVKIPQFQRQFVWERAMSARLIDSMVKGYPIGTFIFWRTDEELRAIRNIGNLMLPLQSKGEFVNYVLDGQQRITSIFAAFKGERIERENGRIEDYSEIYLDLLANGEDDIVTVNTEQRPSNELIKLRELLSNDFTLLASYPEAQREKISLYQNILRGYNFSVINLKQASIDVATEVFTRLNTSGRTLSLFEIMVAKTYDATRQFDLSEKFLQLRAELADVHYGDLPAQTVLQVVSMLLEKEVKRATILKLDKQRFIDTWPEAVSCIKSAIDFFRGYGIPVLRLLPYATLVVPFAYFFHKHPTPPTGEQLGRLEDFFWRVSLGSRYSSAVESKLVQDIKKIDALLRNKQPHYQWTVDVSSEGLVSQGSFSTGRSFVKAILCLYAKQHPRSFDSNQTVRIDNAWLKVSTSKNYHHFFPIAFMKRSYLGRDYWSYNHVLNITIVDDFLNKNRIRAKAPADYMQKFAEENPRLEATMRTHLIGSLERFGVLENDYDKFQQARAKRVSKLLSGLLIDQETGQEEQIDDVEEILEEEISEDA